MDINTNAFRIVNSLTQETKEKKVRTEAARIGGRAGGRARAQALTAEQRRNIARRANRARWRKAKA